MPFAEIKDAIDDIRFGRMVVVVDDEDSENEGDLTIAAEKVTPEVINFMARFGRGLICLPMTGERLDELRIPLMVRHPRAAQTRRRARRSSIPAGRRSIRQCSSCSRSRRRRARPVVTPRAKCCSWMTKTRCAA